MVGRFRLPTMDNYVSGVMIRDELLVFLMPKRREKRCAVKADACRLSSTLSMRPVRWIVFVGYYPR